MGLRQDMESYITSNNLQSTLTGKALKSKLPVQEEPKITRSDITPDKAVAFLKFIITDNQFVGKQRKQLFPQTFENKPLDSIAGRSTIRLLPALSYILDNDSFDMEKADFTIEVSGQTQQNMALRRLKFNQLRDREKRKKPEENLS